ncbi:hypothetical protein HD554DRAFT_1024759 [Boletus coccyginus]|nr:hypothetical protein HD554DRAFT_1024759 [Boletus coccyginus]
MSTPSQFFSELSIRQFVTMGGYAVLTYDYVLTFDLEVDHIWHAPWTTPKIVFLLTRYGTLIGQSFILLEELGILSHGSRKFCANFQWFQAILIFFSSEATRILLLLRSWALWKCSHRVVVSLVSTYVFYVLMLSGFTSYIMFKYGIDFDFPYLDDTGVCVVYVSGVTAWPLGLIS